tara:strand:- start:1079 stop:1483 length:405 start_codon:yes stop_codon:yes gene_type:complete
LFVLDQRLENDSILVENKESFQVRLMNVKEFFWVVLIPNKPNLIELSDISVEERNILLNFASDIGDFIKFKENLEKINIGMLGNVVSQLHIHIVVRSKKDPAWPGPVWGWSDTNKLDNNTYDYRLNLVKSFLKT